MCDCDCELPKQEKWAQIRTAYASELLKEFEERTDRLEADSRRLAALEAAGVDNWGGYSHAMAILHGEED